MEFIETKFSRKNPGHYTPGVISNGMLFISGQLSIIPETGEVCPGGIVAEAKQALANMEAVLLAAGLTKEDVIMCRVYIYFFQSFIKYVLFISFFCFYNFSP